MQAVGAVTNQQGRFRERYEFIPRARCGIYHNIENKNALPSMTAFFYICEYFNISPKEFFDDKNSYPEQIKELVDDLLILDTEQIAYLRPIIKELKKVKGIR